MSALRQRPSLRNLRRTNRRALLLAAAGCLTLLASAYSAATLNFILALTLLVLAMTLSFTAMFFSTPETAPPSQGPAHSRRSWRIFGALLLLHAVASMCFLRAYPANSIDTFTFQRDSLHALLHGVDPYGATQPNIYNPEETRAYYGPGMVVNGRVQVGFQYPPLTLLWAAPGYLLGDLRASYVLADLLAALFCFVVLPGRAGLFLASFLLINPLGFDVEVWCWTEPLVFLALTATMYAAVKQRWWLPIALGLFLATKQYNVLALPFVGFLVLPFAWKPYFKLLASSLAVALATVLPFVLWNSKALWHDLVLFHLAQPFRSDALSLAVVAPVMLKAGPVLVLAWIACSLRFAARTVASFAAGYGTCLLLFFATSKQAFTNYYFLIGQTLLLAAALSFSVMHPSPDGGETTRR